MQNQGERLTTRAVENDQHTSTTNEHIPKDPPEPPLPPPDKPAQRPNILPSIQLKEERRSDTRGEMAMPDDVQNHCERPRSVRNECVDETDTPGHFDLPEAKVHIEVEWRHGNVVDSGELDVIDYGCKGNEHVVETNTQH